MVTEKIGEWCVVAVLVAGFFALIAAGGLFISAQIALRHADGFLTSRTVEGLPMTIRHANQILKETGETLVVVKKASVAQGDYWNANTKKISKLLDNADGAVSDLRVVEGQLAQTIADANRQINGEAIPQATEDLKSLQIAIENIQPVLAVLQRQADNPDIPAVLSQIKGTTENLNKTTGDIYELVHNYKRKAEQPKTFLWRVFSALTGVGAKAGQISTLAK